MELGGTWKCHVCREDRPDRFILVYTRTKELGGITMTENVRYCNDRPECKEGAKTFSHFDPPSQTDK